MPTELLIAWGISSGIAVVFVWATLRPLSRPRVEAPPSKNGLPDQTVARRPRRWGTFFRRFPWMLSAVLLCLLLTSVVVGLRGYRAFVREDVVGVLRVTRAGDEERFVATFALNRGKTLKAVLSGDQVQVDARVLKWTPAMNFLGLHTNYELDRMVGRFSDLDTQNARPPVAVKLGEKPLVDLFAIARSVSFASPIVDATYGSSSYIPAEDGAAWELRISTTGLLFRPLDSNSAP